MSFNEGLLVVLAIYAGIVLLLGPFFYWREKR